MPLPRVGRRVRSALTCAQSLGLDGALVDAYADVGEFRVKIQRMQSAFATDPG
jgi:hypothetical protein